MSNDKPMSIKHMIGVGIGISGAISMICGVGYMVWKLPPPYGVGLSLILGGCVLYIVSATSLPD